MVAEPEQYLVHSRGKRTGVILSLKHYEQLLEDLHDLAVVAERRDEGTVSLQELRQRLEEDGLL
jgi:PHD/YefM family antitoxin component YafN of YafNO toxin-antitoxin module